MNSRVVLKAHWPEATTELCARSEVSSDDGGRSRWLWGDADASSVHYY